MFDDRVDAGRQLARLLTGLRAEDAVVLGLPRGGVPVAAEVANELGLPLDVIVVRKLGIPYQPEVAMGAIGEGGVRILDHDMIRRAGVRPTDLVRIERSERAVLHRRTADVRSVRRRESLRDRTAVVVDDGVATGATMLVASRVAYELGAARVVVATPVAPDAVVRRLKEIVDDVVCVVTTDDLVAVGAWYRDFSPTTDEEVRWLLHRAAGSPTESPFVAGGDGAERLERADDVTIGADPAIGGRLTVPVGARGIVLFAHGSGSSRFSPRNRYVSDVLVRGGFATLLVDLLTAEEELCRSDVFDIELLAERLVAATDWAVAQPGCRGLPVGYFGASTGAAAAVVAATRTGGRVRALVSRGGRPDLAGPWLSELRVPTLMIVGSQDPVTLALNRRSEREMNCVSEVLVVHGASHLFPEPGALQRVAVAARWWFDLHLDPPARVAERAVGSGGR